MIIGKAEFIKETLKKLKEGYEGKTEISYRRALRTADMSNGILDLIAKSYQVTADDIRKGRQPEAKKTAIYILKKYTDMTNAEIGKELGGLSYSGVAKALSRLEEEMGRNRKLRNLIGQIEKILSNVKG